MSAQSLSLLTLTVTAAGPLAAGRFVTPLGAQAAAGDYALGVARSAAAPGDPTPVDVIGTALVEAGAAVARGDTLKAGAQGRGIPWATSGAKIGLALQAAAGAGQTLEALLLPNAA